MGEQSIATVTDRDVKRIVRRDFPIDRVDEVLGILDAYDREGSRVELFRVQAATLKLAAGNIDRLRSEIDSARCDYRDVLAAAEYPEYCRKGFPSGQLPEAEMQRIFEADRQQYEEWFNR